ncbi:polysaccharide biosynthesis protein [Mycoplasmatota bacterium]|nr:polysaccharide biosynthesis protein [Mycoplasmatota bacterium]
MNTIKTRLIFLFILDTTIIFLSYIASSLLITNFNINNKSINHLIENLYWIIPVYILSFMIFRLYKSLWRYASVEEAVNVLLSVLVSYTVISLVRLITKIDLGMNIIIVANLLVFLGLMGIRYSYRTLRVYTAYNRLNQSYSRTLIIGAGNAGHLMIKEIKNNPKLNHKVVCLIDDDKSKKGKIIQGIKVVGSTDDLKEIVSIYKIDEIIVALPSANRSEIKNVLTKCDELKIKTKILPPFYEVIDKKFNTNKIRDVQIEDLLGRDEIKIDDKGISDFIQDEVVLVTGGGGSIGSELCRQIVKYHPKQLIILDIYENNAYDIQNELLMHKTHDTGFPELIVLIASVRDEKRLVEVFSEYKPTVVFHAAAHKHVPLMEISPKEAIKNNIFGTCNVAKISDQYNVKKFVLISSDKAVNPTNIMGATKRFAEMIIQAFNKESKTQYAAVRFGNVLGSNGSVIPLFKKQIAEGGPVTVTHKEIIRYFMTIPEAVQLVLQAGTYANGGEIFVLDMGEPVKILELAEKLIRFSGYEPYSEINIEFTGLRPGEKLYEELLMDEEGLLGTRNDKIFVSQVNGIHMEEINKNLIELNSLTEKQNVNIQDEMVQFVPTFKREG